jgi:hypothetical protein
LFFSKTNKNNYNNKLKQAFVGKPLTQKQIANWERMRSKGRTIHAAWVALWWGTMMVVMLSLVLPYANGASPDARVILLNALIDYPVGFLVGLAHWFGMEKKYHERPNVK